MRRLKNEKGEVIGVATDGGSGASPEPAKWKYRAITTEMLDSERRLKKGVRDEKPGK